MFEYRSAPNPYAGSIGELLVRGGDIRARALENIGAIQANAIAQKGQIWGGLAQSLGQIPSQILQQRDGMRRQQLEEDSLRGQIADRNALAADRQQRLTDATALDQAFSPAAALGPGGQGPMSENAPMPSRDQILANIPGHLQEKVQGVFEKADELANASRKAKLQASKDAQEYMGFLGAQIRQAKYDPAIANLALQHAADAHQDDPAALQGIQQMRQMFAQDPTAIQRVADAAILGSSYRTELQPKTREVTVTNPDGSTTAQIVKDEPGQSFTSAPKPKTGEEGALDAFAKSIGKPNAALLTYAERQQFEKDKAKIGSDQAFANHMRERAYDNAHPTPVKDADQNKLEQQYRTVLTRAFSSRAGGIGSEDAKVQQANHLLALLDQTYDPKSDTYTIPKTLQGELAAGLARLVAPGGNVGIEMMREFDQKTAKGDLAGALSYVTGHPFPTASNDFAKLLKDSIERQGSVAEQNREGSMSGLRALAPTELAEDRRLALERANLNPLRQTKVFTNAKGERRLLTSVDGGTTWR